MTKLSITLLCLTAIAVEGWSNYPTYKPPVIILPTYRPPVQEQPKSRWVREVQQERANYIPQHFGIPVEEDSESAMQNYNTEEVTLTDNLDSLKVQSTRYQSPEEGLDQNSDKHHRNARNVDHKPLWWTPSMGQQPRRPVFIDDVWIPDMRYARDLQIPEGFWASKPWGPRLPSPTFPRPGPGPFDPTPISGRFKRDFQYPKWNPHGSSGPWHKIPSRRF